MKSSSFFRSGRPLALLLAAASVAITRPPVAAQLPASGSLASGASIRGQITKPYGAETPQAAVAGIERAARVGDTAAVASFVWPEGRVELASPVVSGILMVLGVLDPESFPADTFSAKELAEKKKTYGQKKKRVLDVFRKHGLEKIVETPAPGEETQQRLVEGVKAADAVALLRDATPLMDELSDSKNAPAQMPSPFQGKVTGYKVSGDRATARAGKETIELVKLEGRWFLKTPSGPVLEK